MGADVSDEGLHPAGDDPDWQESAYLTWRDPAAGLGGNHRIGNEANQGTANLWCGVYRDDGTRFRHNGEALGLEVLESPGMVAGPQRLFHDGTALRFVLDGDGCRVDLVLEDDPSTLVRSGADAFAGSKGSAGAIFSSNFHAFCRASGTATLDGRTTAVDAWAWRDHSWGVRRWDSFLASRSCGGSLGERVRFRYGSMVGTNGSFFRHGSLIRDGQLLDVADARMLVSVDDDGLRCPAAQLRFRLADGSTSVVDVATIGGMIGATRQRYGWESVGDAMVDGEGGGWAFLEVNNNPRNGHDPPAFALADALTNGVAHVVA